jgi:hypothetical protein
MVDQDEQGQFSCFNDSSLDGTPNRNANQRSECSGPVTPGSLQERGREEQIALSHRFSMTAPVSQETGVAERELLIARGRPTMGPYLSWCVGLDSHSRS